MAFHKKVYEGFDSLARRYPERFIRVDGNQTPQEIFADVIKALKEKNCL